MFVLMFVLMFDVQIVNIFIYQYPNCIDNAPSISPSPYSFRSTMYHGTETVAVTIPNSRKKVACKHVRGHCSHGMITATVSDTGYRVLQKNTGHNSYSGKR